MPQADPLTAHNILPLLPPSLLRTCISRIARRKRWKGFSLSQKDSEELENEQMREKKGKEAQYRCLRSQWKKYQNQKIEFLKRNFELEKDIYIYDT